jgi:4-amino-4-deoxy-L-arabinose transferase-like glycosyltransferase
MRETVLVWTSDKLRSLTTEEELQANSRYRELALERLKDQLLNHPGKLLWGRVRVTAHSYVTPGFMPALSASAQRVLQSLQFVFLLVPAAAAVWIRRKDRRVLLVASLPAVVGLTYAAILICERYVFPLMPAIILLAAAGWLHLFDRLSARRAARKARAPF